MRGLQMFFRVLDPHRFSKSFMHLLPVSGGRDRDPEERTTEALGNISFGMMDETLGEWLTMHNPPINPLSSRVR